MPFRKATLIQDIQGYIFIVKPLIARFMEPYISYGIDEESVLEWMITEEIERTYHLFTEKHYRRLHPQSMIRDMVDNEIRKTRTLDLQLLTAFFIKAPRLYADNNTIDIEVKGQDLYIRFHRDLRFNPF